MKALILAAGKGSRINDLTDNPKCLIKFGNKSIIEHQIDSLNKIGINDIYVVTGYKADEIKKVLKNKVKYINNELFEITGTIYSTHLAKTLLYNDDFLMLYGDLILDEKILDSIKNKEGDIILLSEDGYMENQMYLKIKENLVEDIGLNMNVKDISGFWTCVAKLSKFGSKLIFNETEKILDDKKNIGLHFIDTIVKSLIKKNIKIKAYSNKNNPWYNINSLEDLEYAKKNIFPLLNLDKY